MGQGSRCCWLQAEGAEGQAGKKARSHFHLTEGLDVYIYIYSILLIKDLVKGDTPTKFWRRSICCRKNE